MAKERVKPGSGMAGIAKEAVDYGKEVYEEGKQQVKKRLFTKQPTKKGGVK